MSLLPGRQRHAHGGRDAGGGMADAEGVVVALRALRKACQSTCLTHVCIWCFAAGENFVGIGLVPHIPDDTVVRGVVDMVQGNGQFNDAEARAEMAPGLTPRCTAGRRAARRPAAAAHRTGAPARRNPARSCPGAALQAGRVGSSENMTRDSTVNWPKSSVFAGSWSPVDPVGFWGLSGARAGRQEERK